MKVYMKKKVWDIETINAKSTKVVEPYRCLASEEEKTAVVEKRSMMDMYIPLDCCTAKLHRWLIKKSKKVEKITIIMLLDDNSEVVIKGYVTCDLFDMTKYTIELAGEVTIIPAINWNDVENGKEIL